MRQILLIISLFIFTFSFSQQKQYFDKDWNTTSIENALYYRVVKKNSNNLYLIDDYYIDGSIQMKGHSSDKNDTFEGKVSWYDKEGNLTISREYIHGKLNGKSIQYTSTEKIIATGIFKDNKPLEGIFRDYSETNSPSFIPDYKEQKISYLEYKNGREIATLNFYKDSNIIAQRVRNINDEKNREEWLFYDKKGNEISQVLFRLGNDWKKNGTMILFYIEDYEIISIKQKRSYIDNIETGEEISYNKDASEWFKGYYKDGKPFDGDFLQETEHVTYKKGQLIYKNKEPYNGIAIGYNKKTTYKDGQIKDIKYYFDKELTLLKCDKTYKTEKNIEKKWYTKKGKLLGTGNFEYSYINTGLDANEDYTLFTNYKNGKRHGIEKQYSKDDASFLIRQTLYANDSIVWTETTHPLQKNSSLRLYSKDGSPFEGEEFLITNYEIEHNFYKNAYQKKQILYTNDYLSDSGFLETYKHYEIVENYDVSNNRLGKCFKSIYPKSHDGSILYLCKNRIIEYESSYQLLIEKVFFKGKSYTLNYNNGLKEGETVEDKQLVYYKNGIKVPKNDKIWKAYHENGKLKEIGKYENGIRVGIWKTYRKNGNLWEVGQYNNTSKRNGKWKQYHNNGKISTVYEYTNGIGHKIESYDENGEFWKNKKTGKWKSYNEDGELYRSGEYLNGMEVGEWTWYYSDGQIDFIFYMKDNKNTGLKSYYPNGKIKTISVYKNDKEIEKKEYYRNGKLEYFEKHEDGKRNGEWKYYYKSGALKRTKYYTNNLKSGTWKTYFESGQLAETGNYKNNENNGEWKYYYDNGQLNAIGKFDNGFPIGEWIEYYKNGIVKEKGNYKSGEKTGEWYYYNEEGKPIKQQ